MWGRGSRSARVAVVLVASLVLLLSATPARATDDAEWSRQWGPQRVGVEHAFAAGVTGAGLRIGIVDTGVDLAHPDLAAKIVDNAACIGTDGDQARCSSGGGGDVDGHGTHVAGIAAAFKDNGAGIAGVAPGANLVVARVFERSAEDGASVDDVNAGIKWAVDRGAKVVNLSLGDYLQLRGELFGSSSLNDGIAYAWDRGAVAVLAAGNSNYFGLGAANYGDVNAVVVGATGREDEPARYSSPTGNAKWALVAPGGNRVRGGQTAEIFSTVRGKQYGYMEGTSMAAPHVAGALALLMSQGKSNAQAVTTLLETVNGNVACGSNSPNCRGRLDVACAVVGRCGGTTAATPGPGGTGTPQTAGGEAGSSQPGPDSSGAGAAGGGSGETSAPRPSGGSGQADTSGATTTAGTGTRSSSARAPAARGTAGRRPPAASNQAGSAPTAVGGSAAAPVEAVPATPQGVVPGAPAAADADEILIDMDSAAPPEAGGSDGAGPEPALAVAAAGILLAVALGSLRVRRCRLRTGRGPKHGG